MSETRKLAAILVADIVGYSRLTGTDEEHTLARLRALRSDLIDPTIAAHHGRIVKRTGDGSIIEFRSVVDAVRCAMEVQNGMVARNVGLTPDQRIVFRVGIHVGDVVEESDGDLMGDGVNIAARLEGVAKPGGICLSEDAYRQVQGKVEASFADAGEQRLKNISRPVRAFHLALKSAAAVESAPLSLARRLAAALRIRRSSRDSTGGLTQRNPTQIGFLILLALAGSLASVRFWPALQAPQSVQHPLATTRSIAVLPFRNVSGEKEQDYFAEGLSDDLITRLSQISDLSVIARSSMSAYKDRAVAAQEVGQELGVRYVLDGSVQKSGDRTRINANLIEAGEARQVWAEQYDEEISNIFSVQDKVIDRIVSALTVQLTDVEQRKLARAPTNNLEAYDYYLRAENEEDNNLDTLAPARAMAFYAKAVELDPNFADAQAGYALAAALVSIGDLDASTVPRKRAYEAAGRALELDPNNSRAYVALSALQLSNGRHSDAVASARRAVSLAPHDPGALAQLGMILAYSGDSTEAIAVTEQALHLTPSPPPIIRQLAGIVFYNARQYDRAIEEMKAVSAMWPTANAPHEYLAAAYADLGKLDLARSEAGRIPDYIFPKPSLAFARLGYGAIYKRAEDLNRHLAALKAAGIPEWPLGFEGRPEDQVTGQALAALAVGHTWTGYVIHGENTPFIQQIDEENRVAFQTAHSLMAGVIRLENDRLCMQFDGYLSNLWLCGAIYRTVADSRDAGVDYVHVLPDGLRYFSVKD